MPRSTELTNRAVLSTGCKIACRIATATAREGTWDRLTVKLFLIGVLALADMPIGGLRDDFPEILPDEINRLEHETRALRKQFDKLDIVPSVAHEHLVSSLGRPGLYRPYFVFHRDREARVMIDQAVSIALSRAARSYIMTLRKQKMDVLNCMTNLFRGDLVMPALGAE